MKPIFFYDRVIIYSKQEPHILKEFIPVEDLKNHSLSFEIKTVRKKGLFRGYRSMVDFVLPDNDFLRLLNYHEHAFMPYFVSYIEISKDMPLDSKKEALRLSRDFRRSARKKWARTHFIYTDFALEKKYDPNRFEIGTLYSRSKNFGFRSYSCISKPLDLPAFHREWIVKEPETIKGKTSIKTTNDLLTFDLKEWFQGQDERYLTFERIDKDRLGKWVLNWGRKKKFTKRERMRVGLAGQAYTRERTPAELTMYFRKLKRQIRKKKGPRTEWERRVLKMNPIIFVDRLRG